MNKIIKKLALFMSFITMLGTLPVNAYELDERGDSEPYISYQTSGDEGYSESVGVDAEIGSEFEVTIPKVIVFDGSIKRGNYQVSVDGDIAGYETINVIPERNVKLYSINKAMQKGIIAQNKESWRYFEFDEKGNGLIKADGISAGRWTGTFYFNIFLDSYDPPMVLGDIVFPPDLDDDYRLKIEKLIEQAIDPFEEEDVSGIYDGDGNKIASYDQMASDHGYDAGTAGSNDVLSTHYPNGRILILPNGLTSVADKAFSGTGLGYVHIPDSVTFIGDEAFKDSDIEYARVPKSVKSVGKDAFSGTPASEKDHIYYGNTPIKNIKDDKPVRVINPNLDKIFENNDVYRLTLEKGCRYQITALYNFRNDVTNESDISSSDETIVLFTPDYYLDALEVGEATISGTYNLPDGRTKDAFIIVTVIDPNDESGDDSGNTNPDDPNNPDNPDNPDDPIDDPDNPSVVIDETLPDNLTIEEKTIISMLESNVLKDSNDVAGLYDDTGKLIIAYDEWVRATGFNPSNDYTDEQSSSDVLNSYLNAEYVVLPDTVESIGTKAFKDMHLKYVYIPETVKIIDTSAFENSSIKYINIPKPVELIGENAFANTPAEADGGIFYAKKPYTEVTGASVPTVRLSDISVPPVSEWNSSTSLGEYVVKEDDVCDISEIFNNQNASAVSVTSSNENVIVYDGGKLKVVGPGTAKVTFTTGTNEYSSKTCTFDIKSVTAQPSFKPRVDLIPLQDSELVDKLIEQGFLHDESELCAMYDAKVIGDIQFPVSVVAGVKASNKTSIKAYHYNGTEWEYVASGTASNGKVSTTFNSLSPIAYVNATFFNCKHNTSSVVNTANYSKATCVTDGAYDKITTCGTCKKIMSITHEVVPATGHRCYDGVCSICGEIVNSGDELPPIGTKLSDMTYAQIQKIARENRTAEYDIKINDTILVANVNTIIRVAKIYDDHIEFCFEASGDHTAPSSSPRGAVYAISHDRFYNSRKTANSNTPTLIAGYPQSDAKKGVDTYYDRVIPDSLKAYLMTTDKSYQQYKITYSNKVSSCVSSGTVTFNEALHMYSLSELQSRYNDGVIVPTGYVATLKTYSKVSGVGYINAYVATPYANGHDGKKWTSQTADIDGWGYVVYFDIG